MSSGAAFSSSVADTDEIIKELRALASSMLESAQTYARSSAPHTLPPQQQPQQPQLPVPSGKREREREAARRSGGEALPSRPSAHADPNTLGGGLSIDAIAVAAVAAVADEDDEDITKVPTTLSPQAKMTATNERSISSTGNASPEAASPEKDDRTDDGGDDTETRRDSEGGGLVEDGVRTHMLFRVTDPTRYTLMEMSAWTPEPLLRDADGNSVSPQEEEEGEEEDTDGDADRDNKDAVGEGAAARGKQQGKQMHVLRMPSFPYGGGVTEAQAEALSERFNQCLQKGASKPKDHPRLVSKEAFDAYEYEEVPESESERLEGFNPSSLYEFVTEVQDTVMFSASRASRERRKKFRQLAKENKAPATVGTFNLRVIMDPYRTGFEEEKEFPIVPGDIVADRYQIIQLLGKATFSRAVRCYDLHQPLRGGGDGEEEEEEEEGGEPVTYAEVCLKIINNSKDFFDQSLDEIRLLTLINTYKDPDEACVVRLLDAFYYKEHTMLVTELLSENLYEYSKYNREEEEEFYFTIPRLRRITRQIVQALSYVHSLNLVHADLKPENILFLSYRRCLVKVIDFGSSCFLSDYLSAYVQSRSYRAPEVVLGCDYDGRLDVWSLGGILYELATGKVLFNSETVPEMLARMVYVCGVPLPRHMLWEGRSTCNFINKFGCIYETSSTRTGEARDDDEDPFYMYTPVAPPTEGLSEDEKADIQTPYGVLRHKLREAGVTDPDFVSFVEMCLTMDHKKRPTSEDLLSHPFIVDEVI